jgi:hypothetical protein
MLSGAAGASAEGLGQTSPRVGLWLGTSLSTNLGEQRISPAARVVVSHGKFESAFVFDKSAKVESGAGWLARGRFDVGESVFGGVGFTHRSGGTWTKNVVFARVGTRVRGLEMVLRQDLNSPNRVSILQLKPRHPMKLVANKRLSVEPMISIVRYDHGKVGSLLQLWVGLP